MQKWLFAISGSAIGMVAGLLLAAAFDSPGRQRTREAQQQSAEIARLGSSRASLEATVARLENELAESKSHDAATAKNLETVASSTVKMIALGLTLEKIERHFERIAGLQFEAKTDKGAATQWEAVWERDGIMVAKFYAVGYQDKLIRVGVLARYTRGDGDMPALAAGTLLLTLFFPDWSMEKAQDWMVRARDATARDWDISHAENNVRVNFSLQPSGQFFDIYATKT